MLAFAPQTRAGELPSCNDLSDMANGPDDRVDALQKLGAITEGDEVDSALGELAEALGMAAQLKVLPHELLGVKCCRHSG